MLLHIRKHNEHVITYIILHNMTVCVISICPVNNERMRLVAKVEMWYNIDIGIDLIANWIYFLSFYITICTV